MLRPFVVLLALVLGSSARSALAEESARVIEEHDGRYLRLFVEGDPAAQGWLYEAPNLDEEEDDADDGEPETPARPVDLLVALHGAGGDPRNFILPRLTQARGAYCLAVAGRREVPHATGRGFQWSRADVATILRLTRHVLKTRPIRKERVLVWGHSAGGAMTLATLAAAPDLFAGALTTAAGVAPEVRLANERIFVILGEDDPNIRAAPAIRAHIARAEKKRGAGALLIVEWLGHELPPDDYLSLGFDWVLDGRARGGEAGVKLVPRGAEGPWRHILVRHAGAQDADETKRTKKDARKLLEEVRAALAKGTAYFPFEAARLSEDDRTASAGGAIEEKALLDFLPALPAIEPDEVSAVLDSPVGLHLVLRSNP